MSQDEIAHLMDVLADRLQARLLPEGTHVAKSGSEVARALVEELHKAADEVARG